MELNKYIEYTNLDQTATLKDIEKLCNEAIKNKFAAICINPYYVPLASSLLKNENIEVSTAIGYPIGMNTTGVKAYEAIESINSGSSEINLFINIGAVKDKDYDRLKDEIEEIRDSIDGHVLKVVVDEKHLREDELIKIVEICNETFVNYICINYHDAVDKEIIELINKYRSDILEVGISGTVITSNDIYELIELGVNRISINNIMEIMEVEKSELFI